jgi:predicted XRE-type DNA-binding protein
MKNKINNNLEDKFSLLSSLNFAKENLSCGIHQDMNINAFKVNNINKGMTVSGVFISDVVKNKCSEFIIIKKNTFYKNIPSRDTILTCNQKIRIDNKDKKAEALIDGVNIKKIILPESNTYNFLSDKKNYLYINNLQILCDCDKNYIEDDIKNSNLFL